MKLTNEQRQEIREWLKGEEGLHLGVANAHFWQRHNQSVAYILALLDALDDYDVLEARLKEAVKALQESSTHMEELAEAWRRGSLRSIDGDKDGERSNRNMDALLRINAVLAKESK